MNTVGYEIAARDFSRATLRKLAKTGVTLLGPVAVPGVGAMPWANAERAYSVNDNGTGRILSHAQVLKAAE